jgi:hypothetical protein
VADERSPGGSRIYRHEHPSHAAEPRVSGGDPELIAAIDEHLDRCFGEGERWVFHELVSPTIHLDLHLVPPTETFPFQRLVTSGMAERSMTMPEEFSETRFAELTIALPADWPMSEEAFAEERVYWPIRLLKDLARMTHEYSTFLWYGHTIPNGDPPEPYADGMELCCAFIAPPVAAPDDFAELLVGDGRSVRILAVVPLYAEEMRLKLKRGSDALYDLFDEHGITDVVDPTRPSVAPRRRRFGR